MPLPSQLRRLTNGRLAVSILLAVILVVVVTVPLVSAHAALVSSTPESGAHVSDPPDEVTLRYSAGVQLATVSVVSADGERVSKSARIDPQDQSVVHVPLEEDIKNGTYLVKWKVLSADGHTVSGSFFFVVGDELPTREQLLSIYTGDDGDQFKHPAAPIFRALLFGGLIVLVGAPITLLFVLYPLARTHEIPTTTADRATRVLFGGALFAVFVSATALAVIQLTASSSLSIESIQRFATTASGVTWLARIVIAFVLGVLTALIATKRVSLAKQIWLGALLGGGLLMQLTVSWTSHSFAVTGLVGLLVDFGHLIGGALWMGGLVVLALLAPTFLKHATNTSQVAAQLLRRFSVLAIAGVALVSATGLAIAAWHVPTVDSLSATLYGTALSVKVLLVLLVVGLGGLNRFILHRKLRASTVAHKDRTVGYSKLSIIPIFGGGYASSQGTVQTFIRSVRLELVLLVVVLLLSGLITSIPTAANAVDADQPANELVLESEIDDVTLTLTLVPGQVGPNVITVNVTKNGEPVQTKVPVTMTLKQPVQNVILSPDELDQINPGTYSTVATIPTGGMWHIRISTWTAKAHVVESFMIHVGSPNAEGQMSHSQMSHSQMSHSQMSHSQMSHSQMSHSRSSDRATETWLPTVLRLGALGIGLIGIVAVSYEMVGIGLLRRD